ncbi:MAG: F0F1 ATP synthase subunit B [Magnetovibrio sp.]|nr:F0F1 ATP synthase subunit B [Magnetovibrio sp.]
MFQDPTFWVLVSFVMFVAVLVYLKVPGMVTGALDKRAEKIKSDLDEAEALLTEAQDLLASYQKKQREAADEAEKIKAAAREEAKRITDHGQERLAQSLERREKLAMDRIAQAEAAAVDAIKAETVDIAIDATRELLATKLTDAKADAMIGDAIKDLPKQLN